MRRSAPNNFPGRLPRKLRPFNLREVRWRVTARIARRDSICGLPDGDPEGWSQQFGKRTCKPNSVECGHSSRRDVTADAHQRPTRRFRQQLEPPEAHRADTQRRLALSGSFPPYLVLLRVGFTMPPALPSERCALTAPFHPYPGDESPWRYVFCGTGRLRALTPASRTLSGTLPCGVRTFLPRRPARASYRQRPPGPPAVV